MLLVLIVKHHWVQPQVKGMQASAGLNAERAASGEWHVVGLQKAIGPHDNEAPLLKAC